MSIQNLYPRVCHGLKLMRKPLVDVYNSINPSPWVSHKEPFPKGNPEGKRQRNIHWITDKEKRIFGMKMRTLEETARDILADYEAHGWK